MKQQSEYDRSDLRIELRFKNAILYRELNARYLPEALKRHKSGNIPLLRVASEDLKMPINTLRMLLNLKISPYRAKGEPSQPSIDLAEKLGYSVPELFPPSLYAGKFSSAAIVEAQSSNFLPLNEAKMISDGTDLNDEIMGHERFEAMESALIKLSPREEKIIKLRFGLDGNGERTLQEIADMFEVSRDRIRQIESKALRKLRHPSTSDDLKPFVDWTPAEEQEER